MKRRVGIFSLRLISFAEKPVMVRVIWVVGVRVILLGLGLFN